MATEFISTKILLFTLLLFHRRVFYIGMSLSVFCLPVFMHMILSRENKFVVSHVETVWTGFQYSVINHLKLKKTLINLCRLYEIRRKFFTVEATFLVH